MLADITNKRQDKNQPPNQRHQNAQHDPEPRTERAAAAFVTFDVFEGEDAESNRKHRGHYTNERETSEQATVPGGDGPKAFAKRDNPVKDFRVWVIGDLPRPAANNVRIIVIVIAVASRTRTLRNGGVRGSVANQFLPTSWTRECRRGDFFATRGANRRWSNIRHAAGPFNISFLDHLAVDVPVTLADVAI
jgi:hypothetical protein